MGPDRDDRLRLDGDRFRDGQGRLAMLDWQAQVDDQVEGGVVRLHHQMICLLARLSVPGSKMLTARYILALEDQESTWQ
jgi:hypothetical protein